MAVLVTHFTCEKQGSFTGAAMVRLITEAGKWLGLFTLDVKKGDAVVLVEVITSSAYTTSQKVIYMRDDSYVYLNATTA